MIRWILGYILGLVAGATISIYGVYVGWWIWQSDYIDIYDVGVLLMAGWTIMYMSITLHQGATGKLTQTHNIGESMKRWKILVLTPYIIMLATLLFYALLFGAVELLGLVIDGGVAQTNVWFKQIIMFAFLIFQAAVGIEIPFILIYTIILAIALFVRWIIAIAHLRKKE